MDISWIRPEQIADFEIIQLRDESVDVEDILNKWEDLKADNPEINSLREKTNGFLELLEKLKKNDTDIFEGFNSKLKNIEPEAKYIPDEILYDKILGGWNGRAAGCLLGKPVEKYSSNIIKEILLSNNSWPLDNYITDEGLPGKILKKYPWNKHSGMESLRENIQCMTEDDDLNYTMLNLHVLEKYGKEFTTENVAQEWLEMLPVLSTFTAERIAYKNLLSFMDIKNVPIYRNPFREWIGAMIRADIWGWVSAGNPVQAVKLAYKDASLSHTSNGIIGEMYISAAIALSFIIDDPVEILIKALEFIPEESKIYEAAKFGITVGKNNNDWEKVVEILQKQFGYYFWVHSVNNISMITASISFSKGDFEKAICSAVSGGWDTDSDGATVGAIIGTIKGYNKLPPKWINPLKNNIRSSLKGFDNSKFDQLAKRTLNILKTENTSAIKEKE